MSEPDWWFDQHHWACVPDQGPQCVECHDRGEAYSRGAMTDAEKYDFARRLTVADRRAKGLSMRLDPVVIDRVAEVLRAVAPL